jgi:hypothetical protein
MDNPKTRSGTTCPLCYGEKDHGLVACWQCYRGKGLKYGNPTAERIIEVFEAALALE